MNENTPAISLDEVHQRVGPGGRVHAVRGVSATIRPGEIVALLGPNGAGKTTLMDMVLGLTRPAQGRVSVLGQTPRAAVRAGRVGAELQTGGLLPDLTVRDTIRMIAAAYRDPAPVGQVLEDAQLTQIANRRVKACSGGEQQRIRFALAILPQPDLLVLDEPTTGMDPSARRRFWNAMASQAERGRTILFATHYLEEAESFAERIIMMGAGRILADGPVDEVRSLAQFAHVSCRLPAGMGADGARCLVEALPEAREVHVDTGRLSLATAHSDETARVLLAHDGVHDLQIRQASLDDAFAALTDSAAEPVGPSSSTTESRSAAA
ncbi:ABC transporter ATP-binding protein [Helcobacillus sp. ACRRO]|uniref:ABC transporter ATP-binding protein n=1 Tax=Helcobacillus sp. ACRRO TaxID=2918202 RepID=UPI001EF3FF4D|nr:ABC transporter ATP-binding protein [Helcobacillus sp. ACRRO]MCG7427632.1 ABC transporter ATP-binding protein [Helcobacillus sp. ACRRO]